MALEDLTGGSKFLSNLVPTNPVAADDRREGDDHIRGIKNVLRNTFPNVNGAIAATDEELQRAAVSDPATKANRAGDTFTGAVVIAAALVDLQLHVRGLGAGETAFDGAGPGVWLTSASLSTGNKITPAVRFGTTDPDVVGENPKTTAAIWGEGAQTFTSDTASAMDLVFGTSPANAGPADTVLERVRIKQNGIVVIGTTTAEQFIETLGGLAFSAGGTRRLRINPDFDVVMQARSVAPTLANMQNAECCFTRVSDTSLKIYMRGNDGVLRSATLTLS